MSFARQAVTLTRGHQILLIERLSVDRRSDWQSASTAAAAAAATSSSSTDCQQTDCQVAFNIRCRRRHRFLHPTATTAAAPTATTTAGEAPGKPGEFESVVRPTVKGSEAPDCMATRDSQCSEIYAQLLSLCTTLECVLQCVIALYCIRRLDHVYRHADSNSLDPLQLLYLQAETVNQLRNY